MLRSVIEVAPLGIVVVESAGRIVLANSELEQMFGYAGDELIGQMVDVLVPAKLRAQHAEHRERLVGRPAIRAAKARIFSGQRKDGTHFPVEIGLNPIATEDGTRTLVVVSDIGERSGIGR